MEINLTEEVEKIIVGIDLYSKMLDELKEMYSPLDVVILYSVMLKKVAIECGTKPELILEIVSQILKVRE